MKIGLLGFGVVGRSGMQRGHSCFGVACCNGNILLHFGNRSQANIQENSIHN